MPVSLFKIENALKMEVEAFASVTCVDKQKPVFQKGAHNVIHNACTKHEYLHNLKSGIEVEPTKGIDKFRLNMLMQSITTEHIIHIKAPVYIDGKHEEAIQLGACYTDALNSAKKLGCKNITIPLISSKVYGYPYEEAFNIAMNTINGWLTTNDMDVSLLIFDKKTCVPQKALRHDIDSFINNHYEFKINPKYKGFWGRLNAYADSREAEEAGKYKLSEPGRYIKLRDYYSTDGQIFYSNPNAKKLFEEKKRRILEELGEKLDDSFSVTLMELINAKGKTAVEVYKRANIDRKLFSKIRNEFYFPGKRTTIALAIALELSLDETKDLLKHAGYTLSRSLLFDVIIEYFIMQGNYNIFEINTILFSYDQPTLGG